ncbi:MAG TPA: helix-turn-helix domain-containing protein, partial [Polyangia bacterium]|nr:helix-turn-helix domain-containing protein [Polyangia bacterium]
MAVQAYRFALDPTPTQARDLARHCGAARVAFNWGLA